MESSPKIKDIPLPSGNDYKHKLIERTEHLCKHITWKAFFYFNPSADGSHKETFGCSSCKLPPQVLAMLNFEKRLLNMIETIKFRKVKCEFQQKFSSDIYNNIMKCDTLLVPEYKTSNFYKMDTASYNDLLQKNITKTYKKVANGTTSSIAKKMHLDEGINITAKREAFITLKDHKPNFVNNPICLINPSKTEIGRISKQLLDHINASLANHLKLNRWKNTKAVFSWFTNIQHKDMYSFIAFSMSLWGATTVLNLASLLVLISSTKSKRSLAVHALLAYTEITASGYPKHHHGKQSSSKKICAVFSEIVA